MREAVMVAATRTAVGRAATGSLRDTRPEDMLATVLAEVRERTPGLKRRDIDDVIIGCARPESEQGLNIARVASLLAGLPDNVPGQTVNRFCASGLQAIALGAQAIMCGFADTAIAGGVESMSLVPIRSVKFSPHPRMADDLPEVYMPMGLVAENVAKRFKISRAAMDEFAARSHQKAVEAIGEDKFKDEIVPVKTKIFPLAPEDRSDPEEIAFDEDQCPQSDVSPETFAALGPAYDPTGTVTAAHSAPPADGAAAVMLMSRESAQKLGIKPMAAFRHFAVAGVAPDVSGIGPTAAVPKLLRSSKMQLDDFGLIELNEAFASQALHCIRTLGLDDRITNVNGGAIALGHPLGCTGARLTVSLLYEMKRRNVRHGLVTMGVSGGMGAAAAFELENPSG